MRNEPVIALEIVVEKETTSSKVNKKVPMINVFYKKYIDKVTCVLCNMLPTPDLIKIKKKTSKA